MQKYLSWKLVGIGVLTLIFAFISLPSQYRQITDNPEANGLIKSIQETSVILGLDLQGGTQLDYKIDLRKVEESQHDQIIKGVVETISRRVNALGVSEPNIYTSKVGDEQHIIVELAGIDDVEEAKAKVGKTIQLEFKEQLTEQPKEEIAQIEKSAADFLTKAKADAKNFSILAEEEAKSQPDRIQYNKVESQFKDQIQGAAIADAVFQAKSGEIIDRIIKDSAGLTFDRETGQLTDKNGYFVIKVLDKKDNVEREKTIQEKSVKVQHILISYKNASRANEEIKRSKSEAKKLAEKVISEVRAQKTFDELVKKYSDEPGAKDSLGVLSEPVTENGTTYVPEFTKAAVELNTANQVTDEPVETEFGFHIIKAVEVTPKKVETIKEAQVTYEELFISDKPTSWKETALNGEHFESATVEFDQLLQPYVAIQFNNEGAKLFSELTERNIGKPLAIFVGGDLISDPIVQVQISDGRASISGGFNLQEAESLARDLNTGAIPAPITLAGQYNIGSTLGEAALKTSLIAGVIGLAVLSVYMIGYYRLLGLIAVFALIIYTLAMIFIIKISLPVSLAIIAGLIISGASFYKVVVSKEASADKFLSSLIAIFTLFFFTFLLREPIVLTLAGIAGLIMSIGIAVDANILIFERIREEIKEGKDYRTAIEIGFDRAWSSIRDSNFSSLITCVILFYFGNSIIKGFALNLAAGILVSMFTAITITYSFLLVTARKNKVPSKLLLGVKAGETAKKAWDIVKYSRTWIGISVTVIVLSIGAILFNGFNLGIDFRGGTLMEVELSDKTVTKEVFNTEVNNIIAKLNSEKEKSTAKKEEHTETIIDPATTIESTDQEANKTFIARFGYIDNKDHEKLIQDLEARFGDLTENRFTTIGAKVSDKLKQNAIMAVLGALAVIVLYIAFAFRTVPKEVSAWKFGGAAMLALAHDVIITAGVFAFFKLEVDSLFITALLAVVGFSINDTIVVFDRLRENLKNTKLTSQHIKEIANAALNQTMARSVNTSMVTLLPLLAMLFFGADSIVNFILALVIGISVGTYSSIFIATPLLISWYRNIKT